MYLFLRESVTDMLNNLVFYIFDCMLIPNYATQSSPKLYFFLPLSLTYGLTLFPDFEYGKRTGEPAEVGCVKKLSEKVALLVVLE